ncbi:MAG: fatty-acyl-CoA synthase [Frankiales bacterium]|jgi:fatty-acyl-CoA synthase|nr:fatty-acyl-CoA synthase [Frankiales bacterium]
MMDVPLNGWLLFDHAETHFSDVEVVTANADGTVHRCTYGDVTRRSRQLMRVLDALGLANDATVATLAWNSYRHLEAYFGVPLSGRVLHTLNLRLSSDELGYIISHAGDAAILVDSDLLPLLQEVHALGGLETVKHVIVFGDELPDVELPGLASYEQLLAEQPATYPRTEIDEQAPFGICYTSGTTGRSKGVQYTHRSTVLHALTISTGAGFSIGPSDCVLPVVPMFHANAWGVPHAATMLGAKQVLFAGSLDVGRLVDLMIDEDVTVSTGVPTIWLEVADEFARRGVVPPSLRHVVSGGAQPPRSLIEKFRSFGVPLLQAWGMTETGPLASVAWPKHHMRSYDEDRLVSEAACQAGLPLPCVDVTVRADDGQSDLAWDGQAMGPLLVRGPWVIDSYLHGDGGDRFDDGWFATGDVAVGSPNGYFRIADRTKDLIKSGGEWISSVDMEAALMGMSEVLEAAVVAIPDAKWQERPLACVVVREGASVTLDQIHERLSAAGFARWQLPQEFERLEVIPRTSVGKFDKKLLRAQFTSEGSAQ